MAFILCSTCFCPSIARGESLQDILKPLLETYPGTAGVLVRHLETGEEFQWRADAVQPTASLIKLAVMITAYRQSDAGQLDLNRMLELQASDKVPGSGILTDHFSAGMRISIRDAIRLMIRWSDNTATNLVVRATGLNAVTETMQSLGFPQTQLHSFVYRGDTTIAPERSRLFGLGSTTAREIGGILEALHRGTVAAPESCRQMLEHLKNCEDRSMLARDLPESVAMAHKTGAVSASRCDAGIVYGPKSAFLICVLTTANPDRSWDDDNAAHLLMGRIARAAYDHFNPAWEAGSGESPELRIGAFGVRVEMLQRTLNARLTPSPNLGADGDFGPATEAAVRRFQESAGLTVTGIADAAVWERLGPVVEAASVPEPDVVNAAELPRAPADDASGPPFVSCDAWVIVDADSGLELAGQDSSVPRHFASTTKMMTAWLTARLADASPAVLDEVITMSARADETRGSTAEIRSGESLPVREAVYGLMLPSGNDMSVALAEHFGSRVHDVLQLPVDASESLPADPLLRFVDAMNREARRLQMQHTSYRNPHGLTDPQHKSTPADLALLARQILQHPLLQPIVSTRLRGATVKGPGGYRRNVVWKNTNELLAIDGYAGVKTGTTDQAGACLVSSATRGERRLILVVLGSAASEARYTDSRNLYRWAWQELVK
ncbi:MAG: D-alanyl-D-alanine carboxypeptidase DacC precursor [Planctomycetota bacterium]|jgi:D-alanyl-D-alanine carboxypeptidase (penicillin-binding protein 5/6)